MIRLSERTQKLLRMVADLSGESREPIAEADIPAFVEERKRRLKERLAEVKYPSKGVEGAK